MKTFKTINPDVVRDCFVSLLNQIAMLPVNIEDRASNWTAKGWVTRIERAGRTWGGKKIWEITIDERG